MSASPLFLSYPCLKSVVRHLEIDKRKPLAKLSLQFRKIDNQLVYRVNCLKFVLKKGSDKAMLSIDSVKWVFEKKDGLVVVKCSLDPLKVVELPEDEFGVPWEYFQCFMNSERIQICKLELVVKNAKKLIVSQKEAKMIEYRSPFQFNAEGNSLMILYGDLRNEHIQVSIHLTQIESFVAIVRNLLNNPHGIGSFYKATFRKASFTQQFLWELLEKYFDAKKMSLDRENFWNCMTISDDEKHFEVNCYVDFLEGQDFFRGVLAIANLTFVAVKMEKGTAKPRVEGN